MNAGFPERVGRRFFRPVKTGIDGGGEAVAQAALKNTKKQAVFRMNQVLPVLPVLLPEMKENKKSFLYFCRNYVLPVLPVLPLLPVLPPEMEENKKKFFIF